MTHDEQRAELTELGITDPATDDKGDIVLTPDQLARVLAIGRRNRLELSALRRAVKLIEAAPLKVGYKLAELRQATKVLEHRLRHLVGEVARRRRTQEDYSPHQRELVATTVALARLEADVEAADAAPVDRKK